MYAALLFAGCFIGALNLFKLSAPLKILTFFLFITFVNEILSIFIKENNSLLYTIYTPMHFLLLSLVFLFWLKGRIRYVIIASAIMYTTLFFIYMSVKDGSRMPYELILIDAFFLVSYSIAGYYQILLEPESRNLSKSSRFWFYNAIIIFFCGSFVLWISYPFLLNQPLSYTIKFYFLGWVLNMIQYSLMTKALLLKKIKE